MEEEMSVFAAIGMVEGYFWRDASKLNELEKMAKGVFELLSADNKDAAKVQFRVLLAELDMHRNHDNMLDDFEKALDIVKEKLG